MYVSGHRYQTVTNNALMQLSIDSMRLCTITASTVAAPQSSGVDDIAAH